MITSLLLKLPDLDNEGAARLQKLGDLEKANFNQFESRDHGKWSDHDSGITPVQGVIPIPLPPLVYPGSNGGIGTGSRSNDFSFSDATTGSEDQPKLCPDPSPESINGRDPKVISYQA